MKVKNFVIKKTLPFVTGMVINAERLDLFNKVQRIGNVFLKRAIPIGGVAVTLAGCGAPSAELTSKIKVLQDDIEAKDLLIDSYLEQLLDLNAKNKDLLLENNALMSELSEAKAYISKLEEENKNLEQSIADSVEVEMDTPQISQDKKYTDYLVEQADSLSFSPVVTTATEEMKSKVYSANDLWIFDTTKLAEDDASFKNIHDYRKYWLLEYGGFYDSYRYTTFNYFNSLFNGTVDSMGKRYDNYFIGNIVETSAGYYAIAGHYDSVFAANDGSYDSAIRIAQDNPVPMETYCHLNDFLTENGLTDYIADSYSEADLLNINLLLNANNLELGKTKGR